MTIDLTKLQHFLDKGIIQVKEKDNTLFDIAGFPHYENVVSNMYAYFLDPAKDHGLGTLFLDALQALLQTNYSFTSPRIKRECTSNNGGRIDLVIQEEQNPNHAEGKTDSSIILIENKMYHDQLNDFEDYYRSFEAKSKKGVLLTLRKTQSKHTEFVNITHEQLIDEVLKSIGQFVLTAPYRTIFMLNEFSKNLKNFTMEHEVNQYYTFYQQNRSAVKQVEKLKAELVSHTLKQLEEVPQLLPDLKLALTAKYNTYLRYYKSSVTDSVFFTVFPQFFDDDQPRVTVVIELNKSGIERLDEINSIDFRPEEKSLRKEITALRTGYIHYAEQIFPVSNGEDYEKLGEFIKHKIETTPLKSIFLKIEEKLK